MHLFHAKLLNHNLQMANKSQRCLKLVLEIIKTKDSENYFY